MSSSTGKGRTGSERGATNELPGTGLAAIDRRKAVVGIATAALLGVAGAPIPAAAAPRRGFGGARPKGRPGGPGVGPAGGPTTAALSDGGAGFNLNAPSSMFLREKRVRDSTVM